ncbi:MAG: hypothetical protein KKF30_10825 [Proteobacteria bacterium]|nr:hypothetical protein [Pseudomonadota bacterium]MBU4470850.1 hypothetical protein [Pseudomonadota bacterium]MCG2753770.1 hypothetical protein [Desulfobacteraceae bacterium]
MKLKLKLIQTLILSLVFLTAHPATAITVSSDLCQEKISETGTSYSDVVKIFNKDKKPVEIKFYQKDYRFFSDGTNQFGDPGKEARSNAGWIKQLPQQATIQPEETLLVNYTVDVPNDGQLTGSYWSMIMVEQVNQEELEMLSSSQKQTGIHQLTRYGIQVVTHIGDTGTRQIEFKNLKLIKNSDKRFLQIDMANSGTRALRTALWVDFYAETGGFTKKVNGTRRRIFPDCGVMQELDLGEIPPGDYKAVVVADAGEETVFGTSFSIKLNE